MKLLLATALSISLCFGSVHAVPVESQLWERASSSLTTDAASLNGQMFDYVIVGGGTAGLVAAHELSQDSQKRVLVLEAGGDPRANDKVSRLDTYTQAFGDNILDWNFQTVPQQVGGKSFPLHAGKGIGGSSGINGAAFSVCPASQIDAHSTLTGSDFSWNEFESTLKSLENYHPPTSTQAQIPVTYDPSAHGTNGPVDLGFHLTMQKDPQDAAFVAGIRESLSVPRVDDLGSGDEAGGSGYIATYVKPGQDTENVRVSAATAFYSPIESSRSNLVVLLRARANKIVWQDGRMQATATGVQFESAIDRRVSSVSAKKVIVASGTIRSPMLLEQSGVGDSAVLNKLGVQQVIDLPGVGKNLIEQFKVNVHGGPIKDQGVAPNGVQNMIATSTVDQLMSNASDVHSYVQGQLDGWAQSAVDSGSSASKEGLLRQYQMMVDGIFNKQWPVAEMFFLPGDNDVLIQAWTLQTFSRGSTHATSTSAWSNPTINPRYFTTSIDMDMFVASMRGTRRVFQSQSMKNVLAGPEIKPGFDANNGGIPDGTFHGRYDRWAKFILDAGESVWHLIGTCAMMPRNLGGVVGTDFKLYGSSNVYIIDASVIPTPLSVHYTSVILTIAKKAASMIR